MSVPTRRTPDADLIADADDALERARKMPAGLERIEALKAAGILRNAAASYETSSLTVLATMTSRVT
jgi:hypothetical protein